MDLSGSPRQSFITIIVRFARYESNNIALSPASIDQPSISVFTRPLYTYNNLPVSFPVKLSQLVTLIITPC